MRSPLRLPAALLALLTAAGLLHAGKPPSHILVPPEDGQAWHSDLAFATRYVDRGITLSRDTWQPGLHAATGPWSFGLWCDLPTPRGQLSEFDPWLQYTWEEGSVIWCTGATHIWYPEASGTTLRHSTELFLSAARDWFVTPQFVVTAQFDVTYDLRLRTLYLDGRLSHAQSLKMIGVPLDVTVAVIGGHVDARDINPDDPSFVFRDAHRWWGAQLEVAWQITERTTLRLLGQIDGATNVDPAQGATGNTSLVTTLGFSW